MCSRYQTKQAGKSICGRIQAGYNDSMNRLRALSLFSPLGLLVLPLHALAADLPLFTTGWSIVPEACRTCACGFAGVMGTVQNLMNGSISLGVLIAVGIMAWAGFLYITTPANPEARSQANKMLINAVVGFLIIISAWLIVDFVMKVLYSGPDGQSGAFGPWNSILTGGEICVSSIEPKALFSGSITAGQLTTTSNSSGDTLPSGSGPGRCAVRTSGGCDYKNFVGPFGSEEVARQASQICFAESSGNVANVSTSDRMRNDPQRRAFSFGLFQINITQHNVSGLRCPTAFNGTDYAATVRDENLYNRCVAAAKTFSGNVGEAVATHSRTVWREWSTARGCGLADAPSPLKLALNRVISGGVQLLP